MREMAAALASVVLASGAVYLLYLAVAVAGEDELREGRTRPRKKKRAKAGVLTSLKALSARCDAVIASARPPAEQVVLLEQVQLAVDAIGGNAKRKRRRKCLNLRIEAAISRLEEEAHANCEKGAAVVETA
jgi:hypothetical protein